MSKPLVEILRSGQSGFWSRLSYDKIEDLIWRGVVTGVPTTPEFIPVLNRIDSRFRELVRSSKEHVMLSSSSSDERKIMFARFVLQGLQDVVRSETTDFQRSKFQVGVALCDLEHS